MGAWTPSPDAPMGVPGPGNSPPQRTGKPGTQRCMHRRAPALLLSALGKLEEDQKAAFELQGAGGGVQAPRWHPEQQNLSSRSISQYLLVGETHERGEAAALVYPVGIHSVLHLSICDSASKSENGRCCMLDNIFFKSL